MSNGISLSVDVQDGATPMVRELVAQLTNPRGLHEAIGLRGRTLTRDHLIGIAGSRHATANRLGATPSGHWAQAAEKTTFEADTLSATITVKHDGIGRAMHDVEITPGAGKKFLTIPLISYAYNVRAAAVWESEGLFIAKGKNSKGKDVAVAGKRLADGSFQPWYLLVPRVHQAQDRSLLPSDEEYTQAAREGTRDFVDYLLIRQRK